MLHEAIFLAACNATNVGLQVARKKFTCITPFCNCNCCVASCKKSRTTLYFSQRCETSCLRVTSPQQLETQFCQRGPIRAHVSLAGDFKMRPPSCLLLYAFQVAKKVANVWQTHCNLKGFLFVIVALQVARKNASCNMALMHQSIETPTLWVPGKGRGFDIDPGQKASISLPPEARVQIKRPSPWGNKDENIKFQKKEACIWTENFSNFTWTSMQLWLRY